MGEWLHWMTIYAPVVFSAVMWFGPGWCCPPPCVPTIECGLCDSALSTAEYAVTISGIASANGCSGAENWNGTWILPSVAPVVAECLLQINLSGSGAAVFPYRNNTSCQSAATAFIALSIRAATGAFVDAFVVINAQNAGGSCQMRSTFNSVLDDKCTEWDNEPIAFSFSDNPCIPGPSLPSWSAASATCTVSTP